MTKKNIKVEPETFELLKEQMGRYQTWDQFFHDAFADDGDD